MMKEMIRALSFLFALLAVPVFAQETVTVKVEVKAEAAAVAGAKVSAGGISTLTDAAGIAVLPASMGTVQVTVTKDGFLPATATLKVDQAREWQLAFDLQPQESVKEEITVFATRTDRRLQDEPTRIEVLDSDEIEEKMLMTPGDIAMMLNEMGGLRVQTTSPSLGAASVRIQGMRGRYTRFLTDGLPLFGQQGAGLGILQIPPTDLGQVEVIKGVSSALYGAGAMAGVVNLISRRPTTEPIHELLLNRSSLGATDGTLFLASQLKPHWGASLLTGGHGQERIDRDGDGWADLAGYARGIVRPRVFWDGGDGRSGFLTGGVTYENRKGGTLPGTILQAAGIPYIEALDTRRYDSGGNLQIPIFEKYVLTTRFAASLQSHDHRFGEIRERDRHELLFGEIAMRGTAGRNTWVAGFATERDAYIPRDVPRFAYTYVTPGLFVQDDAAIVPWLSLSASARVDFHNRYGTFFSPRLSALLRWDGWTSRLSVGQGFFAPTPLTEETEAAGLSRLSVPKPLIAERGRSFSFDLTRSAGPASATVTIFGSSIRNPIDVQRNQVYQIVNLAQATTNAGVEALATWRKAPLSITASYTYVRSRETIDAQRVDTQLTPRHSIGLVGMWEKKDVGRIGLESYFTGRQRLEQNPYRSESKPYFLFGFLIERKVYGVRLFLNAENLTDVRQTRWNSMLRPNRGVDGRWTVDAWAPLEGRVFNGGARLAF